jgi:hypothetical protein
VVVSSYAWTTKAMPIRWRLTLPRLRSAASLAASSCKLRLVAKLQAVAFARSSYIMSHDFRLKGGHCFRFDNRQLPEQDGA